MTIVRCVYGRRGTGKTTLAQALIGDAARALAFDPMKEYVTGWRRVSTRKGLRDAVVQGVAEDRFRIAYAPDLRHANCVDEAAFLADVARAAQMGYPADASPLTLVVDEANLAYPVELARTERCAAIRALALQGRHAGVGLILVTQRPANVGKDVRTQAEEVYCLAIDDPDDLSAATRGRPDALAMLRNLPKFHFVRMKSGGCDIGTTRRGGVEIVRNSARRAASR